jgi:hypothetical protein
MNSIVDNQREILLSVQGTNIWSGQQPQQYNSQAIVWGGLSQELFSAGQRYQWVPWAYLLGLIVPVPFWVLHRYWPKLHADYLYTPVIAYVRRYLLKSNGYSHVSQLLHWMVLRRDQFVLFLLLRSCILLAMVVAHTPSPLVCQIQLYCCRW